MASRIVRTMTDGIDIRGSADDSDDDATRRATFNPRPPLNVRMPIVVTGTCMDGTKIPRYLCN